jgi:hypothetical protein
MITALLIHNILPSWVITEYLVRARNHPLKQANMKLCVL